MIHSTFVRFFQFHSCSEIGPAFSGPAFSIPAFLVLHFPVLHFPTPEIWSLIFQSYRSVFDLFGPSLVIHFPVLHFQSIRKASLFVQIHVKLPFNFVIIFDL